MAKRKHRRRRRASIRITPLGYFVLGILVVIAVIGIYFVIWSMNVAQPTVAVAAPQGDASIPDALSTFTIANPGAPTPTLPPIGTPTVSPAKVPTPEPTGVPTATPGMANDVRMPTNEQIASAVDGKLKNSGVVLRKGTDSGYEVVDKYAAGTELKLYGVVGDYYFCQTLSDKKYGYMATKFVEQFGLLPGEAPTASPETKAGVVNGTVTATKLALRSVPTTEGNTPIGGCNKDCKVWIYFQVDGFYYVEIVGSGEKGYVSKDYVIAQSTPPAGTPIPG